jgi:hypothetical protein
MGLERVFYGFSLCEMKLLEILVVFAGVILLGRCLPTHTEQYSMGFSG